MSVGPVSPTALSFRAPSSLPVIPCGVFLANGHGLRPPFGRISAVDARSFLRRNGHGLRPPSGRISAVDARGLSPQTLHQPAFPACVPKRGTGFFCFDHPRTEERSQRARPLRPCADTAGCRALRHALRAWIRRLPVARPATAIASSTGPGYHALPTPGPIAATHATAPLPEDGTAIRNRINVLGRGELTGWWPQDRGRQERRCSGKRNEILQKTPSPRLPSRKEAP